MVRGSSDLDSETVRRTSHGMVRGSPDLAFEPIEVGLRTHRGNVSLLCVVGPVGSGHGYRVN